MSRPLSATDIGARLAAVRQQLGPDLDPAQVVDDLESLDTWLLAEPDGTARFAAQRQTSLAGARYATCVLARALGAPLPRLYEPRDRPKLPSKRVLSDIEVLTYRYVAVQHSPRAAVILGALEQQATTTELASLEPDAAQMAGVRSR
jgi:hypothetical protein